MATKFKAAIGGIVGWTALGAIIFFPAGTINYWQAWGLIAAMAAGSALITPVLLRDLDLLERRMNIRESDPGHMAVQIIAMLALTFATGFSAVDWGQGWSHVPVGLNILGDILVFGAFVVQFLVLRENRYASATIHIAEGQHVISTGIYAHVRHPWYINLMLLSIGAPLALGSWWGLLNVIPMLATLIWRLRSEEDFLIEHLSGYSAYMKKVRWRLLPGVFALVLALIAAPALASGTSLDVVNKAVAASESLKPAAFDGLYADSAIFVDEGPYVGSGANAGHAWANEIHRRFKARGMTNFVVTPEPPTIAQEKGGSAYVVVPLKLDGRLGNGSHYHEDGAFTFTLARQSGSWKITSQVWTVIVKTITPP